MNEKLCEATYVRYLAAADMSWKRSSNFYWALGGNIGYLLFQWCVITFLAQVGGPRPVGLYSFALTLTAPVQMFLSFRIEFLQATDVAHENGLSTYQIVRNLSVAAGSILLGTAVIFLDISNGLRWAVLWIGLAKLIDMYTGVHYGRFQRLERMDLVSILRVTNSFLTLVMLMGAWFATGNIAISLSSTALASLGTYFLCKIVAGKYCPIEPEEQAKPATLESVRALLMLGLPLGLASGIYSLEAFIPRFFILESLGDVQLGVYSALGYSTLLMTTFVGALGNSIAPRLGRVNRDHGLVETDLLCRRYSILIAGAIVVGIFGALLLGDLAVGIVYGQSFVGHSWLLMWLVIGGGLQSLIVVQEWFTTVAKRGLSQAKIQTATFVLTLAGCFIASQVGDISAFGIVLAAKSAVVFILYLILRSRILSVGAR